MPLIPLHRPLYTAILALLLMLSAPLHGQESSYPSDSMQWSVLTCSPGNKVYTLYGHSALRLRQPAHGIDIVFNYGVFDFNTPHFLWRFMLGETDYLVIHLPTAYFMREYEREGRQVVEQQLNLNPIEAERLLAHLEWSIRPEHRTYRYNFLTNNCATKILDDVEECVEGDVVPRMNAQGVTYRQLLHECTLPFPWTQAGTDLLLGADCDTLLFTRPAAFLPAQLEQYLDSAVIWKEDSETRQLVASKNMLLPASNNATASSAPAPIPSPTLAGWLFAVFCLGIGMIERKWHRMLWGIDAILMALQGLIGIFLCFMALCSHHPTVDCNWQILLFNPLPLLCMPWVVSCARKSRFCLYHPLNVAYLMSFIAISLWIPQDFAEIIVPLAFGLALRSASYIYNKENYTRKKKK